MPRLSAHYHSNWRCTLSLPSNERTGRNAECWEQSDLPRHARLVYCSHISLDVNTYFCCEERKHSIRPNLAGSMKLRSNS